jgi:hypothetical protein
VVIRIHALELDYMAKYCTFHAQFFCSLYWRTSNIVIEFGHDSISRVRDNSTEYTSYKEMKCVLKQEKTLENDRGKDIDTSCCWTAISSSLTNISSNESHYQLLSLGTFIPEELNILTVNLEF